VRSPVPVETSDRALPVLPQAQINYFTSSNLKNAEDLLARAGKRSDRLIEAFRSSLTNRSEEPIDAIELVQDIIGEEGLYSRLEYCE